MTNYYKTSKMHYSYKSLPELRVTEVNECMVQTVQQQQPVKQNDEYPVMFDIELTDEINQVTSKTKRCKSMFFNKMPVIYDGKQLEPVNGNETNKPNGTTQRINKNCVNPREDDSDYGLCSTSDDTALDKHLIQPSRPVDIKLKAKEWHDRIKRRQTTKSVRIKDFNNKTKTDNLTRHSSLKAKKIETANQSESLDSTNQTSKQHETVSVDHKHLTTSELSSHLSDSNRTLINSIESMFNSQAKQHNIDASVLMNAAAAAAAVAVTSVPKNEDETLQQIIDIVMPPLLISSNFDLSTTNNVAELSIMMQQHLNETVSTTELSFAGLGMKPNANNENNEHIMRTCLNYLEYLNEKHTRERKLHAFRNKISGVIALTLVFIIVCGLGFIMSGYLVNSFARIILDNSLKSKMSHAKNFDDSNKTTTDSIVAILSIL